MYPILGVFNPSAQSIQNLYAYKFTCIFIRSSEAVPEGCAPTMAPRKAQKKAAAAAPTTPTAAATGRGGARAGTGPKVQKKGLGVAA